MGEGGRLRNKGIDTMELYCIDSRLNAARHIKQLGTIRSTLHETHIFPHMLPTLGDSKTLGAESGAGSYGGWEYA